MHNSNGKAPPGAPQRPQRFAHRSSKDPNERVDTLRTPTQLTNDVWLLATDESTPCDDEPDRGTTTPVQTSASRPAGAIGETRGADSYGEEEEIVCITMGNAILAPAAAATLNAFRALTSQREAKRI